MNIPEFPRESQQKIVCGSAAFPLLFAACQRLQPMLDPTGIFSLTTLGLMAVYVAGLLLLDRQRSACRIVRRVMPGLSHDRMTGVRRWVGHFSLWTSPFPSWAIGLVHAIVVTTGVPGIVILEDTMLPKRFAKAIWGVHGDRDPSTGQVVPGIRLVWAIWTNGLLVIPLGFLIWHKRGHLPPGVRRYRTKQELAQALLWVLHTKGLQSGLHVSYLLCDGWYCTKANLARFQRWGFFYITRFSAPYTVTYQGQAWKAWELAWPCGKSEWHYYGAAIGYIKSFAVVWPGVGPLTLAIIKATRHQKPRDRGYLISNDLTISHLALCAFQAHRWTVEVFFRTSKQLVGWGQSPARGPQPVVGHLVLGAVAYTMLELLCPADAFGSRGNRGRDRFHIARREEGAILERVKTWLQGLQWVYVASPLLPWGKGDGALAVAQPGRRYAPFRTGRLKGVAWKQIDFGPLVFDILVGTRLWELCHAKIRLVA